jgi:hypothetical protein
MSDTGDRLTLADLKKVLDMPLIRQRVPTVLHPDVYDEGVNLGVIDGEDDKRFIKDVFIKEIK